MLPTGAQKFVKVPPRRMFSLIEKPFGAELIFVEAILKRIRPLP